jgi:hypothetical protein
MAKEQKEGEEKNKTEIIIASKKVDHKNIYQALAALQGEMKPMAKTGHVEYQTSKGVLKFDFTPLGEIMATLYPMLGRHGLSVRHEITKEGVEAIVTHETYEERIEQLTEVLESKPGQMEGLTSRTYGKVVKNQIRSGIIKLGQGGEMKDTGAAITYAKRYSLTAVLGISSEEDKDVELLEQTANNAMANVMEMAKLKLSNAKTEAEIKKIKEGFEKDLKQIEAGKAPALGLKKDQYELLSAQADLRLKQLTEDNGENNIINHD